MMSLVIALLSYSTTVIQEHLFLSAKSLYFIGSHCLQATTIYTRRPESPSVGFP